MAGNNERVAMIRRSTFGQEVRAPIADSLEYTIESVIPRVEEAAELPDHRLVEALTEEIPEEENYYLLTFVSSDDNSQGG